MKKEKALQIIEKNRKSYDEIAHLFDMTRREDWPEFEYLKKYLENEQHILDIGCGNGRLYNYLSQCSISYLEHYLGVDQSDGLVKLAKKNYPQGEFMTVKDIFKLPFEISQFDIIVGIAFFHHIPSKELRLQLLQEIKRVLRPGGILFMTNWNLWQKNLWKKYKIKWQWFFLPHNGLDAGDFWIRFKSGDVEEDRYYHHLTRCELFSLARKAGFKVKEYTDDRGFNSVISLEVIDKSSKTNIR